CWTIKQTPVRPGSIWSTARLRLVKAAAAPSELTTGVWPAKRGYDLGRERAATICNLMELFRLELISSADQWENFHVSRHHNPHPIDFASGGRAADLAVQL